MMKMMSLRGLGWFVCVCVCVCAGGGGVGLLGQKYRVGSQNIIVAEFNAISEEEKEDDEDEAKRFGVVCVYWGVGGGGQEMKVLA